MRDANPSRTAMAVALRRAAHQLLDVPRVLDDPLAVLIIGHKAADDLRANALRHRSRFSRAIRAFISVRSRFAEDELARALARGTTQYVVLGAGLDTFAYRQPASASGLHVFEVDYPATQAWKRRKLAEAEIAIPSSLTFAPVNFEHQTLADGLAAAGFDRGAPAFFSWLGVTMYLTPEAIASTLAFIRSTPAGGGIVFDYAVPRASLGWLQRFAHDSISRRVAKAGEPFRTFFDPAALRAQLTQAGFISIEDFGSDELNARYFASHPQGLRVSGGLARIMAATA